ncbi:TM2 domain-containing protein [Echinicola soli]|uniref:TM2 domain-containing protein n=1 Tax=Echinicola soli TaxID=2591634 RepID=A0A514CF19_9BACT|nr:TM2 domain-containing protein [Echinicola soli]QDH78422.1 TM2 domain-containing protein [Echinicola soli]
MEVAKVDLFMMMNSKYFEAHHLPFIRERLLRLDDASWETIQVLQFYDPNTVQLVSLVGGQLGIDRFMVGDTGLGILKLLTCGGFVIWSIIDWFMIPGVAREKNGIKLKEALEALHRTAEPTNQIESTDREQE